MEFLDAAHHHAQPRAWTAVSMMLAQVQDQVAARHLAVERRVVVKAVIPIDLEAEKALVEFVGLGDIEDAQDRDDGRSTNARPLLRSRAMRGVRVRTSKRPASSGADERRTARTSRVCS